MPYAANVPVSGPDDKPRERQANFNGFAFNIDDGIFYPQPDGDSIMQLPYLDPDIQLNYVTRND